MKKITLKILGIVVMLVVLLQTVAMAATQSELQNQKNDNQDKINDAKEDLSNVQEQKSSTQEEINDLDSQIADYQSQINELDTKINDLNNQIEEAQKKLDEAQAQYEENQKLAEERLVVMQESGDVSYLDIMLSSSDSIVDMISGYYLASELAEADTELLDSLQTQKDEVEKAKTDLENSKSELDNSKTSKESVTAQLEVVKEEKNTEVAKLSEDEKQIQAQIDELTEANKSIDAEILQKQKEVEEQLKKKQQAAANASKPTNSSGSSNTGTSTGGGAVSSSGFIYPVPAGYQRITTQLYYSSGAYHGAVDFGSGGINGQPVYAVQEGVVVTAKSLTTSYGTYVIIAHPNGLYTLYAHGQAGSLRVSEGDYVSQGQQIMNVGSTGNSTGPHLHFEVRKSPGTYSNRVDPRPYLP